MKIIKKILIPALSVLLLYPSVSYAQSNSINKENPVYGSGRVVLVDEDLNIWIKVTGDDSKEVFSRFKGSMFTANYRKDKKYFKMNLVGLNNSRSDFTMSDSTTYIEKIIDVLNNSVKGNVINFSCYDMTKETKDIIPLCELSISGISINEVFLSEGYSYYDTEMGYHPNAEKNYKNKQKKAESERIGIWTPFYNMFTF